MISGGPPPGLLRAPVGVAGQLKRTIEHGPVVSGIVHEARWACVRERGDEVPTPYLGRVHAEAHREAVHHALDVVGGLGSAGPSVRTRRRLGRHHAPDAVTDVDDAIGTKPHQRGTGGDRRGREEAVRAEIGEDVGVHRQDRSIVRRRGADPRALPAAVGRAPEVFRAVLDPLDGPSKAAC